MNKLLNFLISLLFVFFSFLGKAQQLALSDCFEIGKSNHIDFKIQNLKTEQKHLNKRSLASNFLPEIGISSSLNYNFGSSINPTTNSREPSNIQSNNFSFDLRSNIVNFSKWKESSIRNYDIELEKLNFNILENDYKLLIVDKFLKALTLQEWIGTRLLQFDNSSETFQRINEEVKQGKRANSDSYDAQVIFLQDKYELEKIKQDAILAKLELLQLLNITDFNVYALQLLYPDDIFLSIDNLTSNHNPNVLKFKTELLKNKAEQKQLQQIYLPTLDFVYSYGTFYAQKINNLSDTNFHFQNQLRDNKSQYLGLALYIPVFSKGNNRQRQRIKLNEYSIIQKEELKEKKRWDDLLASNKQQLKFLNESYSNLIEIDTFAKKALETTTTKYIFDKVDTSVYKNAKNQSLESEYNLLSNKIQLCSIFYQLKISFE